MNFIGTASWNLPPQSKSLFPETGTHLERYSQVFNGVEINSSFYRDHQYKTYVKWASIVPESFRFSVKLSRYFTQTTRLQETGDYLHEVLQGISGLGEKWGVLLVQLPPSLDFDLKVAQNFLKALRNFYSGKIVWEPRHKSWISEKALALLEDYEINKVLADPEPCQTPRPWRERLERLRYFRLHGSPEIYRSAYSSEILQRIAHQIKESELQSRECWCIFDNTTFGFATENAIDLKALLDRENFVLADIVARLNNRRVAHFKS